MQEQLNNTPLFSTTDFYATAVLISKGHKVAKVESHHRDSKIKVFFFKKTPAISNLLMSYANGDLAGNIREFKNAIDTVKELVHNS